MRTRSLLNKVWLMFVTTLSPSQNQFSVPTEHQLGHLNAACHWFQYYFYRWRIFKRLKIPSLYQFSRLLIVKNIFVITTHFRFCITKKVTITKYITKLLRQISTDMSEPDFHSLAEEYKSFPPTYFSQCENTWTAGKSDSHSKSNYHASAK